MERYIITFEIFDTAANAVVETGTYRATPLAPAVAVRLIAQLGADVGKGWSHKPLTETQSILYDIKPVQLTPDQARNVLENLYRQRNGPQLPDIGRRSER